MTGGERRDNRGFHYTATMLTDVPEGAEVMRLEPFGPIAILVRMPDLADGIRRANALPYGLAGYAFTNSADHAEQLAREVEVGTLAINHFSASWPATPFGGVKDSGYGREGELEGLASYTVIKNASHRVRAGRVLPPGPG